MQLYFAIDITGKQVILDKEESHHLIHVMRKSAGEELYVTDGKGQVFLARILRANPKECIAEVVKEESFYIHPYQLHMAVAPTKNIDRFEWFIEKAVELGINQITPVLTKRSERKVVNEARLEKLVISAAKQSHKTLFPMVNPLIALDDFIKIGNTNDKYIALCNDGLPLLKDAGKEARQVTILIGPEGDFTPEEAERCISSGYQGISLGKYRLRTETAALDACMTIALLNQ